MADILCIDDLEEILLTYKAYLKDDYELELCKDPEEGLELALTGDYPVILLDMRMPGKSGLEIAGALEKEKVPCKCIMITSHATEYYSNEWAKSDIVYKYMIKPFKKQALVQAIEGAKEALEKEIQG